MDRIKNHKNIGVGFYVFRPKLYLSIFINGLQKLYRNGDFVDRVLHSRLHAAIGASAIGQRDLQCQLRLISLRHMRPLPQLWGSSNDIAIRGYLHLLMLTF
jgi:hypothetical protein